MIAAFEAKGKARHSPHSVAILRTYSTAGVAIVYGLQWLDL